MARVQLSQNIQCPIPVALPHGEYYDAGVPVFAIGTNKVFNKERPGEMYTAWNFHCLKNKSARGIPLGTDIKFLGVTTESTLGQTICSVQGAGVVNISGHCLDSNIKLIDLSINSDLFVEYDPTTRKLTKLSLDSNDESITVGRVHHVYASEVFSGKIQSVDVRLHTGMHRSMKATPTAPSAVVAAPTGIGAPMGGGAPPIGAPSSGAGSDKKKKKNGKNNKSRDALDVRKYNKKVGTEGARNNTAKNKNKKRTGLKKHKNTGLTLAHAAPFIDTTENANEDADKGSEPDSDNDPDSDSDDGSSSDSDEELDLGPQLSRRTRRAPPKRDEP